MYYHVHLVHSTLAFYYSTLLLTYAAVLLGSYRSPTRPMPGRLSGGRRVCPEELRTPGSYFYI